MTATAYVTAALIVVVPDDRKEPVVNGAIFDEAVTRSPRKDGGWSYRCDRGQVVCGPFPTETQALDFQRRHRELLHGRSVTEERDFCKRNGGL